MSVTVKNIWKKYNIPASSSCVAVGKIATSQLVLVIHWEMHCRCLFKLLSAEDGIQVFWAPSCYWKLKCFFITLSSEMTVAFSESTCFTNKNRQTTTKNIVRNSSRQICLLSFSWSWQQCFKLKIIVGKRMYVCKTQKNRGNRNS